MLKKLQAISLSNDKIYDLLNGTVNIMSYPELTAFEDLESALGDYGALVLLYESKKNYGHWTLIFKRDKNTIEFFDSYALFPDDELKHIDIEYRRKNNQLYPHLTKLLYDSGYNIEYNDYLLQKKINGMNTCGRHVVTRLYFRKMSIDEYINMIKQMGMTPDEFVTHFTENIS